MMAQGLLQVFVANPNKTPEIVEVLSTNKEKLLKYLGDFHTDKGVCCRKAIWSQHYIPVVIVS